MVHQKKNEKNLLRKELKNALESLSIDRKDRAATTAFQSLFPILSINMYVLSFVSMKNEICTSEINAYLAKNNQLVLPRTVNNHLELYLVKDLEKELSPHSFYPLLEPNPDKTLQIDSKEISIALIPGLGFDNNNNRIGYGKGYYDRLLSELICKTIGIGYLEQKVSFSIPTEEHDKPVDKVQLY